VVIIRPTLEQVIGLLCTYWDPIFLNLFYIWIVKCNDLLRGNLLKRLKQMEFAVGSYVLLTKGGVSGAQQPDDLFHCRPDDDHVVGRNM
jgi:hypothetical protein